MAIDVLVRAVRGNAIEFATMRAAKGSLERRVIVTAPATLVQLATCGDVGVLDQLVALLGEPDRAWPAQVLLSAMTRREERVVESFAEDPSEWWRTVGRGAQSRWQQWLAEHRDQLVWDADTRAFNERSF